MKRTTKTVPLVQNRLPRVPQSSCITRRALRRSMEESYSRGYADGIKTAVLIMAAVAAVLLSGMI